jgi:carbonic anhydrase
VIDRLWDEILAANAAYAERFPYGGMGALPARRLAVVTCMDARIDPLAVFGLRVGDAKILRNAGGRASTDAIRSLAVAVHVLGVQRIALAQHSRCGMATRTAEEFQQLVGEATGADASFVDFMAIGPDQERCVREDVQRLRESSLLPDSVGIAGFLYDVDDGRLRRLC